MDAAQGRLERNPWVSKIRRQTAEHPFGTLKAWMGSTRFLTRTLPRVSTEMSLHVLVYNMKRLLQIFGTRPLMQLMRTWQRPPILNLVFPNKYRMLCHRQPQPDCAAPLNVGFHTASALPDPAA